MRLYSELLLIGLAASCAAWVHRAPADPAGRASYLCRPVGVATTALEAIARLALGTGAPRPWETGLREQCIRFVEEVAVREGE